MKSKSIRKVDISKIIKKVMLKMLSVGAKEINFEIINMLRTEVPVIMKKLKLTKVPVNNHLNELEAVGLVKRWKGTGKVVSGPMTAVFLEKIKEIGKDVEQNIGERIFKMID